MDKPRGWTLTRMECIPVGIPVVIALDGSTDIKEKEEVNVIEKSAYNRAVEALKGLLNDSQHADHNCGDDRCPVDHARQTLFELGEKV